MLRVLINYGNEIILVEEVNVTVSEMIINELYQDKIDFTKPQHQKLYSTIINEINDSGVIDIQKLITSSDSDINTQTVDLITQAHYISNNWKEKHNIITGRENENLKKTTEKAILSLKKEIVSLKIKTLQEQVKSNKISESEVKALNALIKLKTQIAKLLGRNIG